jgi:hypothetical protein
MCDREDTCPSIVQCLSKAWADFTRAKQRKSTPLYIAAQVENLDVVRCLIEEFGADAMPLMIAAIVKHKRVISYFLKHSADPQLSLPEHGRAEISFTLKSRPHRLPWAQDALLQPWLWRCGL